ncbi:MAG TPA: hypothetical protein VK993_02235 [Chthoniobacterales bacterium]|nr:hypothetical protein [Chthoniobacterales bacterium]
MRTILFAAAVTMLCSGATAVGASQQFYGRVVEAKTGKPLSNVRIRVFNQVDTITAALRVMPGLPNAITPSRRKPKAYVQPAAATRTDANGRFAVKARDLGPADIVCDQPGIGSGGVRIENAAAGKFLEVRYSVPVRR